MGIFNPFLLELKVQQCSSVNSPLLLCPGTGVGQTQQPGAQELLHSDSSSPGWWKMLLNVAVLVPLCQCVTVVLPAEMPKAHCGHKDPNL